MKLAPAVRRENESVGSWAMTLILVVFMLGAASFVHPSRAMAYDLNSDKLQVQTGDFGEISSIKINGDAFPTEYVMNKTTAPEQDTSDHQWLGELLFTYRLNGGPWLKASTNQSGDARTIKKNGNTVTVTYKNSRNVEGIRDFIVTETYVLMTDGHLQWNIKVTNTSGKALEIGDFGLPLPFNEQWTYGDAIYETRVVTHSFVGNNSSYITAGRPSGIGSYLLLMPDAATGAGFEYQDRWRNEEHPGSKWAWNPENEGKWIEGLNVFYIHSNVIKSTNRGYLPNTSLFLSNSQSKDYGFKFYAVQNEQDVKNKLYEQGLVDATVVPGMIVPTNQKAKFDLRTSAAITGVKRDDGTMIPLLEQKDGDHHIYEFALNKLGPQNVTVEYGSGFKTVLQFYGIDPIDKALEEHASFMVKQTQWNLPGDIRDKVFDDWLMNTQMKRDNFAGYWGWGDDWGLTHGEFIAEKNALSPVASEIKAVDDYLETAIWTNLMNGHHEDYLIHDFLMAEPNTTPTYRGFAYPHIYNTYFSMYKIAANYPDLVTYKHPKDTYLLRAYNILKALYEGPVSYNWDTGLMGELTTPDIIQALKDEGYPDEARDIETIMLKKYNNFKNTTYPYGSEYSYDNTGEEAVYTLARMQAGNLSEQDKALQMMSKINAKTRASRGQMPVWYYYADPVTITGENWWNFQYSTSLAGYAMDDWIRYHASSDREEQQRLSYAAKIANISAINSGQISGDPANYGAAAWTYQAEKGNQGTNGVGGGANVPLLNGWRGMTGEADLGLFGALQTLSADIAVDPIFGVIGYGADVSVSDGVFYEITPTDGLYKRINLVTEKLYMELNKDQFTAAKLSMAKDYAKFSLRNLTPGTEHNTTITLNGLKKGAYQILVDGEQRGKLNAFGTEAKLTVLAGPAAAYSVELIETTPDANKAPVVQAGEDFTYAIRVDEAMLRGSAEDDGLPSGALTSEWSLVSGPADSNVVFGDAKSLYTTLSVSKAGTYVFKLTVSDSELTASDTVTVTAIEPPPLPEFLIHYPFDEQDGTTAADSTGNGFSASIQGGASWVQGKINNSLSLNGTDSYALLPAGILSRADEVTISAWVNLNSAQTYSRIFDFGTGTSTYMFLTPNAGGGMRFAITTGGNAPGMEQIIDGPSLPLHTWKNVAVTLSGSTAVLYVDGVEVGRNDQMTLRPSDLGKTKNNYIGKSQFADPLMDGLVDDFRIYSRALSADEIAALVAPAGGLQSVDDVKVATTAGQAPMLPASVMATLDNGDRTEVYVKWDPIDPSAYAKEGAQFTVGGIVVGTSTPAKAQVTVSARVVAPYPSLVLRYNFDEQDGTLVADSSGAGRNGTIKGSLQQDPEGHKNGALLFGGASGNYVDAGSDQALQPGSLTLSYWLKRTGAMNDKENVLLWFKPENDYAGNGFFITYNGNSNIVFLDGANGFYVKQSPEDFLPLNEWTNIVFTFDATTKTGKIYKNGAAQQIDFDGSPQSITSTDDIKKIGVSGYANGAQLNAGLDDFRIYSGAMTDSQVLALYEDRDISVVDAVYVETKAGTAPLLPDAVSVHYENGGGGSAAVSWDSIQPEAYAQQGTFTVGGRVEGTALAAKAEVTVKPASKPKIISIQEIQASTMVGKAPQLPSVVQATDENGSAATLNAAWEVIVPSRYAAAGTFTVYGAVEGTALQAKAIITVTGGATSSPSASPSASPSDSQPSTIRIIGADVLGEAGSEPVVTLRKGESEAQLPANAGQLLGSRSLTVSDGAAALVVPASILKSLAALLEPGEEPGAAIRIQLSRIQSDSLPSVGGEFKLGGAAYQFGLQVRKMDDTTLTLPSFPQGIKVQLPYLPESPDPSTLGVYLLDEQASRWQYVGGTLDEANRTLAVTLHHFSTYAVLSYNKSFSDVPATHWAYAAIKSLAAKHIATGVTDSRFMPGGITTRAEFVTMLVKAIGLSSEGKTTPFRDVTPSSWYADSVAAAYSAGLIQGVSATAFAPDQIISREEMAVLLVKAYEYKFGPTASSGPRQAGDQAKESAWAKASVEKALAWGLMRGVGNGIFDPQGKVTRAQMVQAIYNFLDVK